MKPLVLFFAFLCSFAVARPALPPAGVPAPGDPRAGYETAAYEMALQYDSCQLQFYDQKGPVGARDFRPKAGEQKLGYTFFAYPPNSNWAADHPLQSGWHRAISAGKTPYWDDRNGDRQQQPEEMLEIPYQLWFQVRTRVFLTTIGDVRQPEDLPTAAGVFPLARRYAEDNLKQDLTTLLPGVGDVAWHSVNGTGPNQWQTVLVIRGPALYEISASPLITLQVGPNTPFPNVPRGARQQGDLSTLQARAGDYGYLGMAALAERVAPLVQEELLGLAREFVRNWDAYLAVKVGPGPHLKGHFLSSAELLPSASELSGLNLKTERRDIWTSTANFVSTTAPDNENVEVNLTAWGLSQNTPWANSNDLRAHAEFEQAVKGYAGNPSLTGTALTVPGFDEVYQLTAEGKTPKGETTYTSTSIVFRLANVNGRLNYYRADFWFRDHPGTQPLRDQPLAMLRAIGARAAKLGRAASAGEPALKLSVEPTELWADGRSTARIRIAATLANGAPAAGMPLQLHLEHTGLGQLADERLTTDAAGLAETNYRAGTLPGTTTLKVSGANLSATADLRQGGLEFVVRTPGQQFLTDGATPIELATRFVDPQGKPVANVPVEIAVDEADLPERGTLAPSAAPAADGWSVQAYTPPLIAPQAGWRGGRATFTASTRATGSVPALAAPLAVTLHSGSAFSVVVAKEGFTASEKTPFSCARRNGTVTGTAQAQTPAGPVPLVDAEVTVYATQDGKDVVAGRGKSGADGQFAVEFALEKLSGLTAAAEATPAPLAIAPATQRWLDTGRRYADRLAAKGYASPAADEFLKNFPADLAASTSDPRLPRNTERLIAAAQLLGDTLGYLDELDDQHTQATAWLVESLESAVENLATVVGISDKVKSAQEGLADVYNSNPSLAPLRASVDARWAKVKQSAVGGFLVTSYQVMSTAYAENAELAQDSGAIDAELRQWIKNQADEKLFANWAFDPVGSTGEALEAKFKADLLAFLKNRYRGEYPALMNAAVTHAATRIARGDFSWQDPRNAAAVLREKFARHAARYTQANEAHLNRELHRLNLKLASDTVVKGAAIYFTAKEAIKGDPTEFQKKIEDSLATVDKAFAAFDTAYQTYNGRQWFTVCYSARVTIAEIARDAVRPGTP